MDYTTRVFLISSSLLEKTVILMISDVSDIFSSPARFKVGSCPGYSRSAAILDGYASYSRSCDVF